jgi:UDP-N-acetylglucosamine acyltransferase
MSTSIHPTAIVSPKARIGENVTIGPFCVVHDDVEIGAGTTLMSHVVLDNGARIGADVRMHPGVVIATAPQDLKYAGEPTLAIVGDRTVLRECVTVNRGTTASGKAVVGSDCLLMAYCHVAHDCIVGDRVILANSVQLGGHVEVGDWAILGGLTGVHQFTRIGAHAMVGAMTRVALDIPTYTLMAGANPQFEGINIIGLRRRGFNVAQIDAIKDFYKVFIQSKMNTTDALAAYEAANPVIDPVVQPCIDFIRTSKRGVYRR